MNPKLKEAYTLKAWSLLLMGEYYDSFECFNKAESVNQESIENQLSADKCLPWKTKQKLINSTTKASTIQYINHFNDLEYDDYDEEHISTKAKKDFLMNAITKPTTKSPGNRKINLKNFKRNLISKPLNSFTSNFLDFMYAVLF